MRPWNDVRLAANGRPVQENFAAWFGASAVVGRGGKPLVVYHRTAADFEAFDTTRGDLGTHFGSAAQAASLLDGRMRDGERTLAVYLSIQRPIRLKDVGGFHADAVAPQLKRLGLIDAQTAKRLHDAGDRGTVAIRRAANHEVRAILAAAGFDGVVYRNEAEGKGDSFIAFSANQVKSALGNCGLYLPCSGSMDDHSELQSFLLMQDVSGVGEQLLERMHP